MTHPCAAPIELYRQRLDRFTRRVGELERRSLRLANLRAALFVGAVVFIGLGLGLGVVWWLPAAGLLTGFVFAVRRHGRIERDLAAARTLQTLQSEALDRLDRRMDDIPCPPTPDGAPEFAADLDLVGPGSLLNLLGTPGTWHGRECLTRWILEPVDPTEIGARQAAARELGALLDLRHDLAVHARAVGEGSEDLDAFLAWAEGETWLLQRPWVSWIAAAMAAATVAVIALCIAGVINPWSWIAPVALNLALTRIAHGPIKATFGAATPGERVFQDYAALMAGLSGAPLTADRLTEIQRRLSTRDPGAHGRMRRLDRLASLANLRTSPMAWLPIQAVTLWDLHVLRALELWQRRAGREVRGWFAAVGELEALAALAALHHDHPHWCFPILADEPRVTAQGLGHPLLPPDSCVANDVELGPPGTFLLVTGSNMSGKSTLLRAIGVNAVLAQAGGPVCARRMELPRLILGTSFRVQDSLADGVSYFMAELRRLKEVVDLAAAAPGDRVALFLLDEILLGTNVAERQIAVQQVLGQLLDHRALGAVATHDLTLADADGLADRCQPIHFVETFFRDEDGPQMTFDYRARPGVSPTTNALKLLELVGLDRDR